MDVLLERIQALPYDFPLGTEAVQLSSVPAKKHEQVARMASEVIDPLLPHLGRSSYANDNGISNINIYAIGDRRRH